MKPTTTCLILLSILITIISCNTKKEATKIEVEKRQKIELVTNKGTILLELYNETPLHRDNFINLVKNKAYDSVLFHRVIQNFMIQGGDPDSKNAIATDTLGEGDVPYRVNAEFIPNLFHKKGALAAARDGNPERASSGMQFYIVQGKILNDSLLDKAEIRINDWLAQHDIQKDINHKYLLDSLNKAMASTNKTMYSEYTDSITNWSKTIKDYKPYVIPENQKLVYKTIGGTPHLDQNYTVFGEVVEGIQVVDSIASTPTGELDKPLEKIRIISMRVVLQ